MEEDQLYSAQREGSECRVLDTHEPMTVIATSANPKDDDVEDREAPQKVVQQAESSSVLSLQSQDNSLDHIHSQIPADAEQGTQETAAAAATVLNSITTNQDDSLHVILAAGQVESNPKRTGLNMTGEYRSSHSLYDDVPSSPLPPNRVLTSESPFLESAPSIADSESPRIQAFAKLEFDDGQFYMNTWSVELGRDICAARVAIEKDLETVQDPEVEARKRSTSSGDAPQTPGKYRREDGRKLASSIVSESGGIMGVDMQDLEPRRPKTKKSKSTTSSSRNVSRKNSGFFPTRQTDYQSLAMASLSGSAFGAHPVDPLSPLPSPAECPLVPIHPPTVAEGGPTGHRGISRKHVKIAYNFEKRLFELEIYGRNGAFVDEKFYSAGDIQPLKSGSYIQISGIGIRFVLPDAALGETGAEGVLGSDPASGGKMSFDFEDGRGESITMADSSESGSSENDDSSRPDDEKAVKSEEVIETAEVESESPEVEEKLAPKPKKQQTQRSKEVARSKPDPKPDPVVPPPKRKGPGRPPKNGIISKREQALLARQAKEAAKAAALKDASSKSGAGRVVLGKGCNGPEAERISPQPKPEKRKYTKRKKSEGEGVEQQDVRETTEQTDSAPPEHALGSAVPPKPPKEKKPPKPPRSPSPVFDEATLTPEQLAKPQQSYVVLIHEALTNSKTGAMSLPQIYRAIERRYPFYKLRVQTQGWQSSVRHNLGQHPAFRKIERDGKGWMWGLVPEISIEKEKKRRPSPPPLPPQNYYAQGSQMYRHPYPYPGMPPPNGQTHGPIAHPAYGMHPGMPPGQGHPPYPNQPGPILGPNGLPFPLAPPPGDSNATYQSPYQPAPPSQPPPPPPPPAIPQPQPSPTNGLNEMQNNGQDRPPPQLPSIPQPNPRLPSQSPAPQPPMPQTAQLPPPPLPSNNNIGHDVLQAVGKFKTALIASMPDKVYGEKIVTSAINRTLGIQPASSASGKEDPQEKAIMQALSGMLGNLSKKTQEAQRQASNPPPPPPPPVSQNQNPAPTPPPAVPDKQQIQSTQPSSNQRPSSSQSQQGAQAQLLQLLQQIGKRVNVSPTQARVPQQQQSPGVNGVASPPAPAPRQEGLKVDAPYVNGTASSGAVVPAMKGGHGDGDWGPNSANSHDGNDNDDDDEGNGDDNTGPVAERGIKRPLMQASADEEGEQQLEARKGQPAAKRVAV
ncbi:hypothetical protein MMC24_001839 [Lignoscripta atroalba]|nr:hypothetical protein [Lignoscripta atroalba]